MSLLGWLKKTFSWNEKEELVPPSSAPSYDLELSPIRCELLALAEQRLTLPEGAVSNNPMMFYEDMVAGVSKVTDCTAKAFLRAAKEHEDYNISLALVTARTRPSSETRLQLEAIFYPVHRDQKDGSYYLLEGIDRLRKAEPDFASCDFIELDQQSLKHATALLRVIMHFVQYKGSVSTDTSVFLRNNPDAADQVIDFIEQRGVGMGSFSIELFNMSKDNNASVLGGGVL